MPKVSKINPTSFRLTDQVLSALKRVAAAQEKPQITVVESLILEADEKLSKEEQNGLD